MAAQTDSTNSSEDDDEDNESLMDSSQPIPKRSRPLLLCGHCDKYLTKSTYYRHRELYFNSVSLQWKSSMEVEVHVDHAVERPYSPTCQATKMTDSSSSLDSNCTEELDVENESHVIMSDAYVESEGISLADLSNADTDQTFSDSSDISSEFDDGPQHEEVWSSSSESNESEVGTSSKLTPSNYNLLWNLLFFVLLWQSVYRVSNAAVGAVLRILKTFLQLYVKGVVSSPEQSQTLNTQIPTNIKAAQRMLWNTNKDAFISYVVCPNCDSLYNYSDCIHRNESKNCKFVAYPNHSIARRRKSCDAQLLKKVKTKKGCKLIPIKEYPYQSVFKSFSYLVKKEGFIDACEEWRTRSSHVPDGYLGDIYDGEVWHEYNSDKTKHFLATSHNYLLTLNVDWFQPFCHLQYSVGAIYMTIQNLPRHLRYKEENVILVGLIPGPSEPSLTINSYLTPLVQELKTAWETGFSVQTPSGSYITIRLALTCVSCDIPASRKVSGFLGHNARLGCNKCLKKFPSPSKGVVDYSGFNRAEFIGRNVISHRQKCRRVLNECTKTKIRRKEAKYGVRYSVLLQLPYFDPVRYTVIDIMHNMLLGTGKHMFKVWLKLGILNVHNLEKINKISSLICTPHSMGRLPVNISSNYGGFKAAQWQAWITVYSPVVLKGIIADNHLQCWLLFVRACRILTQRIVQRSDIIAADLLLLNFCQKFELLYGKENCTPNLHLHNHIKDCLMDYGPSHAFWCFSFERYNGLLGSFHTNQKAIEPQIMRKFINAQRLCGDISLANLHLMSFPSHQKPMSLNTLGDTSDVSVLEMLRIATSPISSMKHFGSVGIAALRSPLYEGVFDSTVLDDLRTLYNALYPDKVIHKVSPFYEYSGRATLCTQLMGSVLNRSSCTSSSVVAAFWPGNSSNLSIIDYSRKRIGVVQYYLRHCIIFKKTDGTDEHVEHVFACVIWKQRHPNEEWFGISATICLNSNEPSSMCSFIPIQRIHDICAHCLLKLNVRGYDETVFVAVPIPLKYSL